MTALSIIIVNYRTPELLVNCLTSVFEQTTGIGYEVIVVDNASGDNSREIIEVAFPAVKWIQMEYNAGFARANNEGIRRSEGNTVLLLNSDTIILDNAISSCFNSFSESKHVACGVQLLNADGSPQISGNYFVKGGLNNLLPLPYVGNTIKFIGTLLNVKKPHVPNASAEIKVHWINGAYLMVKKSAMEKVGLMDEDFFLYAEEAEWCYRLNKVGSLVIYGQYKVVHLQGETSNATFQSKSTGYYNLYDRKGLQIMLSNFVRLRKQYGVGWYIVQLLVYTLTIPFYLVIEFCMLAIGKSSLTEFSKIRAFARNMVRLWGISPKILRNKPTFYKVL